MSSFPRATPGPGVFNNPEGVVLPRQLLLVPQARAKSTGGGEGLKWRPRVGAHPGLASCSLALPLPHVGFPLGFLVTLHT